jgi:ATP-dependent protease Clp ATPase subunit
MKELLETATVSKGTSEIIQNALLDCMFDVCREKIEQQIRASECVVIQCDETTDVLGW